LEVIAVIFRQNPQVEGILAEAEAARLAAAASSVLRVQRLARRRGRKCMTTQQLHLFNALYLVVFVIATTLPVRR